MQQDGGGPLCARFSSITETRAWKGVPVLTANFPLSIFHQDGCSHHGAWNGVSGPETPVPSIN